MVILPRAKVRIALLALAIIGLIVLGTTTGAAAELTVENVRGQVRDAGAWGIVLYFGIFTLGQVLHLPGLIFITAGALAFGGMLGGPLALIAGTFAVSVNFLLVRAVGGQPLRAIERPIAKRVMERLEEDPFKAITLGRLVFFTSPLMSTAFALSPVTFRSHLVGSFVGMAPMILGAAWLAEGLF